VLTVTKQSPSLGKGLLARLDARVRHISAARLFWSVIAIDLFLIVAVGLMMRTGGDARFSIEARSEIVELRVGAKEEMAGWDELAVATIDEDTGPVTCRAPVFKMPPRMAGPFRMIAQSDAEGGLTIEFLDAKPGALGEIRCEGARHPAGAHLILGLTADQARRLTLPVHGQLTVGRDVSFDLNEQPILLDGKVYAEASSAPFRTGRFSSETRLFAGDRVILTRADGETQVSSWGFLRTIDGAIGVVAHASAAEAQVIHVGQTKTGSESVAPSFLAKVQAQSQWAVILIMVAILLHMFSALRDYLFERARVEDLQRGEGEP
jgi:hypothetical protein